MSHFWKRNHHLNHAATGPPAFGQAAAATASDGTTCLGIGHLTITVCKARGIKGDEWYGWGKADPYAKIILGGASKGGERQTLAVENAGSHPQWNEAFSFFVTRIDTGYNNLSIKLCNKNKKSMRKDDCLGHFTVANLGELLAAHGNKVVAEYYPVFHKGKHKGEILLAFDITLMTFEEIVHLWESVGNDGAAVRVDPAGRDPESKYKISREGSKSHDYGLLNVALQGASLLVSIVSS